MGTLSFGVLADLQQSGHGSPRMARPTPRQVFDDPRSHWAYLTQPTDDGFEGQHFDRKEAGRLLPSGSLPRDALDKLKELVVKTVSAFANRNAEGGLLVLGISSTGEVAGIDHLTEDQRNAVTNLNTLLRAHAAEVCFHGCQDAAGNDKTICLIYTPHLPNGVCETHEAHPRAWTRSGSQSVLMNQDMRDQVRIRKGLLDTEGIACCPFSADDVDGDVVAEFRRVFHPEVSKNFTVERLLYEAGAIVPCNGEYAFTVPGLLFFAANPQRVLPHAYVRLMRFLVPVGRIPQPWLAGLRQVLHGADHEADQGGTDLLPGVVVLQALPAAQAGGRLRRRPGASRHRR